MSRILEIKISHFNIKNITPHTSHFRAKMMNKAATITCAFCKGTGKHPHFGSTCPVCKGEGENQIRGKFMTCRDCRGSGQKGGTTLTCYTCGGLGVVPDTREEVRRARREIRKAREEMEKEREEFREKPLTKSNEQKLIDKLKAENKRLREGLTKVKKTYRSDMESKERKAMERAIASFCEDCAFGESKECWDIECTLAPYSPVAERIK